MRRSLPPAWCVLVLGLLAGPARTGEEPDAPPPPKEGRERNDPYPEDFRKRVDAAVDKGVAYLLTVQRADGSWPFADSLSRYPLGVTALCTLACLKGGTPPDDPAIERAFGVMRTFPMDRTYSVGVLLMALHARYSPFDAPPTAEKDRYGEEVRKDPCTKSMRPGDREWMDKAVKYLLENESGGHWRYPEGGVDLSNTQYALLGLWAASRCGAKIPPETWLECLQWLLQVQERTGPSVKLHQNEVRGDYRVTWTEDARSRGFRYRPEDPITGAMTTAGLAGLAICQDELWASRKFTPDLRERARTGIRDSLAWMHLNLEVEKNPGQPGGGWHLYYLYGMERAGVLARTRFMGRWDWYLDGAEWLLANQRGDGSWTVEHTHLDTAFAVLFLRRSTMSPRHAAITPREEER